MPPPTQVMQQYLDAKAQAPDALLLFRMGDFYELFYDDAETAARLLNIALTARDKGENPVPMAGFPHHALENHLRKLIEAGQRVAVCDQMESAAEAKGIIRRELTRIVTPGTLTEESLLDPKRRNYLAALAPAAGGVFGLAWTDLASDKITAAELAETELAEEFGRLEPSELLLPEGVEFRADWFVGVTAPAATFRAPSTFARGPAAAGFLGDHFGVKTLGGFGIDDDSPAAAAAAALLKYLQETHRGSLAHLRRLERFHRGRTMAIDATTRRSLELTRSLRDGKRAGTLLDAIDRTVTAAGARRLSEWLHEPLLDPAAIGWRQSAVGEWKDDPAGRARLRGILAQTYDVERLAARLSAGRAGPRDLAALRNTLRVLPAAKAELASRGAFANAEIGERLDLLADLRGRLEATLAEEPPHLVRDGGAIRDGAHAELDDLRSAARGDKHWLAAYQAKEIARSGIANLKVAFNKVFGFYIEVPNSGKDRIPDDYIRRQTVKNAERYITPELKDYEKKALGAEERVLLLEAELFRELRDAAAAHTAELFRNADLLATLDCLASLGEIAAARGFVRPRLVESDEFLVDAGRHPVLEALLPAGAVTPNDLRFGAEAGDGPRFLLVTGPNMAGKSTYIRQAALLAVLAQIGSYVPAAAATLGAIDRVFARVGASDELARGQSTFMVEMTETANILRNATPRSLVVLDEIGRGTSTYDGVALAWAVAEHLHDRIGCRTLFATHYHELIDLEKTLGRLKNLSVAVREWRDEILFLHQIAEGGADRSYGVHVARLAGVPDPVLDRARIVLDALERDPFGERSASAASPPGKGRPKKHRRQYHQLSLFPSAGQAMAEELAAVDVETLAVEDAMRLLKKWKGELARPS